MASVYVPQTDTPTSPPFAVAGTTGIPYSQIINTLGAFVYVIKKMRVVASSFAQLKQPIFYNYTNAKGNSRTKPYVAGTDANNKQPVEDLDVKMVFDGNSSINVNILGGAGVTLYFFGKAYEVGDYAEVSGNIALLVKNYRGEDI